MPKIDVAKDCLALREADVDHGGHHEAHEEPKFSNLRELLRNWSAPDRLVPERSGCAESKEHRDEYDLRIVGSIVELTRPIRSAADPVVSENHRQEWGHAVANHREKTFVGMARVDLSQPGDDVTDDTQSLGHDDGSLLAQPPES